MGTGERNIHTEKIKNVTCKSCQETATMTVNVFAKFFMFKILPFYTGERLTVDCDNCKKHYSHLHETPSQAQFRIKEIANSAKAPWWMYIGYIFIVGIILFGLIMSIDK